MVQLKAYASRALNLSGWQRRKHWGHHGSTRYLWEPRQVDAAVGYVVMGYLVDSSSHYILGVGVPALVASTIVL